jgi:penicillin-binding protein 1A
MKKPDTSSSEVAAGALLGVSRVLRAFAKPLVYIVSIGLTGLLLGGLVMLGLFHYYSKDLPDSSALSDYNPPGMTRFYSRDGDLVAEYAKERRIFVEFADIPRPVLNAFIAAEDQNFYTHGGVDPMGIMRALISNLRKFSNKDRSLVGGSTITQQVVKNFLLTNEKSLERKIKEAILATRISQTYSKDRILELYLNEIYLGMGAYGVSAASLEYFGKELHQLNTEEVALLAGMPKAPANYDPVKFPEKALRRRNYVIKRMAEDGYINKAEYERAKAAPLVINEERLISKPQVPFYSEEVRRWIVENYSADELYNKSLFVQTAVNVSMQNIMDEALRNTLRAYDKRHGYRGVLGHIDSLADWESALDKTQKTTPLFDKQRIALVLDVQKDKATIGMSERYTAPDTNEEKTRKVRGSISFEHMRWARLVRESGSMGAVPNKPSDILKQGDIILVSPASSNDAWKLEQIPKISGAMVAMRPQTGEVLAMSGGYSFGDSQFNRATQAKRQPGSAFKPFIYMAALERGFTPSSIVNDAPLEIDQGPGLPPWRPKNYGDVFAGPSTLRSGLEKSRNLMTVRLAQMIGLPKVKAASERFKIYDDLPLHYSTTLGSQETTVLKLVTAYSMLVNGGLKVEPVLVKRIADREGKTIFKADTRECSLCNSEVGNNEVSSTAPILPKDDRERVADPRIAYQMVSLLEGVVERGTAVSAKTLNLPIGGKTGTTNDSRDAWFIGFTQDLVLGTYIGFDTPKSLGDKETGGRAALPAFIEFMENYYKDRTAPEFVKPAGILEVKVDRITGVPPMPWQQAGGGLITEAFVTGGSIFVPGDELEISAPILPQETDAYIDYGNGYDPQDDIYHPEGQQQPQNAYVPQQAPIYIAPEEQPVTAAPAEIQTRRYDPYSTKAPEPAYVPIAPTEPYAAPQNADISPPPVVAPRSYQPPQRPTRVRNTRTIGGPDYWQQRGDGASSRGTGGLY